MDGDDELSVIAALHVAGMHFGSEHSGCVGGDMTLATFDFLRRIEAVRTAAL